VPSSVPGAGPGEKITVRHDPRSSDARRLVAHPTVQSESRRRVKRADSCNTPVTDGAGSNAPVELASLRRWLLER
jgi:hypothetical protein